MTPDPPKRPPGDRPRLDLAYPCEWRYRVIGADATKLRAAIVSIAGDAEHELHDGNTSSGGAYVSIELVLIARDEDHRLGVFTALAAHEDVKFVL